MFIDVISFESDGNALMGSKFTPKFKTPTVETTYNIPCITMIIVKPHLEVTNRESEIQCAREKWLKNSAAIIWRSKFYQLFKIK